MTTDLGPYRSRWLREISIDPSGDPVENAVDELEAYTKIPRADVRQLLEKGIEEFAREWEEEYKNVPDARDQFYDKSFTQVFFVMQNNVLRTDLSSPYLYIYAADWAKRLGVKTYMDYGSGTGAGAFFFAKQGIDTTCADISARMLDFVKWRFEHRSLKAAYHNTKAEALPKKAFDMITCFHVLQHLDDPVAKVKELRDALTENGILIVNGGLTKDPYRPMQPDHGGERTTRKFRSVGLQILWAHTHAMRALSNTNPLAYQRVERSRLMNKAYYVFDTAVRQDWIRRTLRNALSPFAGGLKQKTPVAGAAR